MCVSNNFLEQAAYLIYNKIAKETIYEIVCVEIAGEKFQSHDFYSNENKESIQHDVLITKIHLRDKTGNIYLVEPNINGLKVAKGEISFGEYLRLQKNAERLILCLFGVFISVIFTVGFLIKLSIG